MALLSGKKIKNNPKAKISFRTKVKDAEYTIGQNNGAKCNCKNGIKRKNIKSFFHDRRFF